MNYSNMGTKVVNAVSRSLYPMMCPVAVSTWWNARELEQPAIEVGAKWQAVSLLHGVRRVLKSSRVKPCNECLVDIPSEVERCPHCSALQRNEAVRLRKRDAGWY